MMRRLLRWFYAQWLRCKYRAWKMPNETLLAWFSPRKTFTVRGGRRWFHMTLPAWDVIQEDGRFVISFPPCTVGPRNQLTATWRGLNPGWTQEQEDAYREEGETKCKASGSK